jgi:uncharacterized protein YbaR (Trm112 family)
MKLETIKKLCCPFDKSDLILKPIAGDERNNIFEGILICSECNRIYPIVSGIPIMSPDEYRDFKLEQPMLENWLNQFEEYEGQYQLIDGRVKKLSKEL